MVKTNSNSERILAIDFMTFSIPRLYSGALPLDPVGDSRPQTPSYVLPNVETDQRLGYGLV